MTTLLLLCSLAASGAQLNYEVAGPEKGAPVILIYGNGSSAATFPGPMLEIAAKGYRVYAIDSRVQGIKPEDTFEFIKTHKLRKPAVVDLSDGGDIGLPLASKHPRSICALVSCSANGTTAKVPNLVLEGENDQINVASLADIFFKSRKVFGKRGYAAYYDCIWSSDQYNAFGDIIKYKDVYYVTFREGPGHVPTTTWETPGVVRVLSSKDCRNWTLACTITNKWFDLRDPHFCVSPVDGSLMCYYALYAHGNSWPEPTKTMTAVLKPDGMSLEIESVHHVYCGDYSKYWIWNITPDGSYIYGIAYWENGTKPILVRSSDGFDFEKVSEIDYLGNEASINIIDGKVYAILRSQYGAPSGYAVSDESMQNWMISDLNLVCHCPVAVKYKNYLLTCVRVVNQRNGDVALCALDLTSETPSLQVLTTMEYHNHAGNCAYAGMLLDGDVLRIVYYAESAGRYSSPDIYYQEYPLSMVDNLIL